MMSFVLHQYYEDNNWNFPKYLLSMCQLAVESLACLEFPFTDMFRCFQKKGEGEKSRALTYTILGLLAGIPMLFIIILLLAGADAVFRNMVITLLDDIKIGNVVGIFLMFFCVCLGSYCLIGALCRHRIPEENSEPRKINPIPAITVMVMLAAVYILFCGIQIFSLFLGKCSCPKAIHGHLMQEKAFSSCWLYV